MPQYFSMEVSSVTPLRTMTRALSLAVASAVLVACGAQTPSGAAPEVAPASVEPSNPADQSAEHDTNEGPNAQQEPENQDADAEPRASYPAPSGIPVQWLEETADAWPDSDGFDSPVPVLSRQECLLADQLPEIAGTEAAIIESGFGPNGDSGYRYVCNFWAQDSYSGRVELVVPDSAAAAEDLSDAFMENSPSQATRDVAQVRVEDLQLQVASTWYPAPERGSQRAMFFDEDQDSLAFLEISSLNEELFASSTVEDVAEALVTIFAASAHDG